MDRPPAPPHGLLIPRTFHFMWLGGKPMPEEFVAFRETWARLHPDWEIRVWDDASLPPLRNQEWFDRVETWSQKVDLASFEVLLDHGGVYLDTDFECYKNIEELLGGLDAFGASEDGIHTCHGIIGAVPGHPLIQRIVDAFPTSILEHEGKSAAYTTGPHHITRVVDAWRAEGHELTVFGPELFYPYHWTEKERRHETFPDAYAAHHWAGSWVEAFLPTRRLVLVDDPRAPFGHVAAITAFCKLFTSDDDVELAITCPPGAEQEVGQRVTSIIQHVGDVGPMPELWIHDHATVLDAPYDRMVFLTGHPVDDPAAQADAVTWMAQVRAALDEGEPVALEPPGTGSIDDLRHVCGLVAAALR